MWVLDAALLKENYSVINFPERGVFKPAHRGDTAKEVKPRPTKLEIPVIG